MNTFKKISGFGAALVLATSMGPAFAADVDQTRSQDQLRDQLNLQTPDAEQAQDRIREQDRDRLHDGLQDGSGDGKQQKNMEQKKEQVRNEYKYKGSSDARQGGQGSGGMTRPAR